MRELMNCFDFLQYFELVSVWRLAVYMFSVFIFTCSVEFLRHMRDYLQVVFKIDSQTESLNDGDIDREIITLTCVGIGYSNVAKPNK